MSTCPTCKTSYPDTMRLCPTDGTVLEGGQAPKDENIGRTLDGKYRLDKRLSSGGMGTVYKATHLMLGKSVAVKLIKADLPASPEVVRRFQREAKAASALNHPNIAPAYDLGQTQDGTLYIAMEYIDGPNLKDAIQAGPIDPARTINLLRQVASALSLAHKHEIIHRDLKPQNIMLTKDADGREVAKLLDFGIAKTLDDSATQLTATGFSLGTPQYMSPEQAYGRPVDGRSDLYSLGIILYEMLVGEVPFSDPSTPAVLVKQMTEAPVPPELKRPDLQISPELAAIALKCLEKDPAKRYQTADEFSAALDAAAVSIGARVLPLPGQTTGAASGTGAAAATVVIGQGVSGQTTQRPTPAPVPTPASPTSQTTAVSATPPPTGATTKIATKPVAAPAAAGVPPVAATPAAVPPVPAAEPAGPKPAPALTPAAAKPTGGAGSRAAVAAVIAILILGGGAYAAYQMGFLKLGGSKDAAPAAANAAATSTPAAQLATSAVPAPAAPADTSAAPPDPNAAAASAAAPGAAGSGGAAASPATPAGSSNPPSGGASGAPPPSAPPAPPSAPRSASPSAVTPPPASSGTSAAGATSTHAANAAAATPASKPASGMSAAASGAPATSGKSVAPTTTTSGTSSKSTAGPASTSTSKPGPQVSAPSSAPAAAPLPANPSVAFRCDGPPDICSALKSAMDQSLSKDSMPSIRDASKAEVSLEGTVTFVDEQTQKMFGQSFTIRNYTIDVNGEARRTGESVPMPSAATLNYDARYRDRLDEKARQVAASVVENIREFWKKK